jgi:hypothetical protein
VLNCGHLHCTGLREKLHHGQVLLQRHYGNPE